MKYMYCILQLMDLKKTVPGSANAQWRLQVEHQGHEALKNNVTAFSLGYSYQVVPINHKPREKKGLKFSLHFVVLKICG